MDQALTFLTTALQIIELRRQLGFPFAREAIEFYNNLTRWMNSTAENPFVITDEMWASQQARKDEAMEAYRNAKPGDIPPIV